MDGRCSAITKAGKPCRGRALPGSQYCLSHDPGSREKLKESQRKGGAAKSTARRHAKQWAALGREIGNDDLPAILRSCMVAVRDGQMLPNEANAIATLARTSVQITNEHELMAKVEALEEQIGIATQTRKVG